MLKTGAAALLLTLAVPGMAQTAAPAVPAPPAPAQGAMGPPPEFIQSAQAYGQCIGAKAQASDPKLTPEAAASAAVAGCQAERTSLETRFESWVSSPAFPAEGREMARAQFKTRMAAVPAQIADGIRKGRAQAGAAKK